MSSMSDERRACAKCGTPMQGSQDWCLQCGAGAPRRGPGWRSAAIAISATGVLVLGAAAAAYAALQQRSPAKTVAQTRTSTTSTATSQTTAPPSGTPTQTPPPSVITTTTSSTPAHLKAPSKPPKIPSTAPTPSKKKKTTASTTSTSTTGQRTTSAQEGEGGSGHPVAVLLDADAAQLYNPRDLASARFGDPSLAIDGDASTAWTMQLQASEAPEVGAGLTLNLNAQLKIAQLTLITETLGIAVQVYGTQSTKIPQSLESEEWVRLSRAHLVKKRKATITLSQDGKRFRQLLVWIISAPTSSSGQFTAAAAAINEIQLYEPK
jgi:cytoskeletal protein RodZ